MLTWAGIGGLGFVAIAVVVNLIYVRAKLPLPVAGKPLDTVVDEFGSAGARLPLPSVVVPAGWLAITVFASGLAALLWQHGLAGRGWTLVGFAGVLLQNASFAVVEALRFGLAAATEQGRPTVAGLWAFSNVVFGFNQMFLATALIGFTAAGSVSGLAPIWLIVLGYLSAAALFISASASPFNAQAGSRIAVLGLIGWLGWITWIVGYSITLLTY